MGRAKTRNQPEPLCRLVAFEATDGIELTGLLYEPDVAQTLLSVLQHRKHTSGRRSTRAIVFLHGTGGASVFDSKRTNLLADVFLSHGIAFLPFNNRGAQLVKRLRKNGSRARRSIDGGSAHELIRECVRDIDGAARFLRQRGYRDLYLVGHSTGANKIAVYDHYKPRNPFRKYVLLAGGDDTGGLYARLGSRRFQRVLDRSREMIAAHRGHELAPPSLATPMMSWRALRDMINPDGDYNVFPFLEVMRGLKLSRKSRFRYVRGIRKPALFVYGERDEYCFDDVPECVRILADAVGPKPNAEFVIMGEANHGFSGQERELGELIAGWCLP